MHAIHTDPKSEADLDCQSVSQWVTLRTRRHVTDLRGIDRPTILHSATPEWKQTRLVNFRKERKKTNHKQLDRAILKYKMTCLEQMLLRVKKYWTPSVVFATRTFGKWLNTDNSFAVSVTIFKVSWHCLYPSFETEYFVQFKFYQTVYTVPTLYRQTVTHCMLQ